MQLKVRSNLISWSRFEARTRKPYVARWENMHKFFSLADVSFLQRFLLWRCLQFSHKILSKCIYFSLKVHIGAIGRSEKSGILEIDAQISALSFEIWHDIHFPHTQQAMHRSTEWIQSMFIASATMQNLLGTNKMSYAFDICASPFFFVNVARRWRWFV